MSLAFPLSWWLVALLLGGAMAVGYGAYAKVVVPLSRGRRAVLMTLRATVLALLVLILLGPVETTSGPTHDAVVSVVLDNSRSMRIVDAQPGNRRLDRAAVLLRDVVLPSLAERFDVEIFGLDRPIAIEALMSVEPDAVSTDLAAAIRDATEREDGRAVAGVIVVSDGGDTGGGDLAAAVDGRPPVFAVSVGASEPLVDLEVTALDSGQATVAGSVVELTAELVRRGGDPRPIAVRLREGGQTLEARSLTPSGDGVPVRVTFHVPQPEGTAALYTVEAPAEADEQVVENNQRSLLVRPPARARRLLMIEGAPGFEHSFLKRVWLADPGVELDAVVRTGQDARGEHTFYVQGDPARTAALGSGFPAGKADLFAYDAVVLANIEVGFFRPAQLAMVEAFVAERGGGLLLLGSVLLRDEDLRGSPIEDLVPVALSGRGRSVATGRSAPPDRLALTDDGADHQIMRFGRTPEDTRRTWEAAPALAGSVALGPVKPGASLLAVVGRPEGGSTPLVAVQRLGGGRSMVFAGEGAWRWKMKMSADTRLYETFWGQAVRWLTASAPDRLRIETGREPPVGGAIEYSAWVRDVEYRPVADARVVAAVATPSGEILTREMVLLDAAAGRYGGTLDAASRGVYRLDLEASRGGVALGSGTEWVLVGGVDREFVDPWANEQVLRRLAERSQGALLATGDLTSLPGLIMAHTSSPALMTRELWHGPWTFLLLLGVLTAEWVTRRTWGMR